jgi:ribosomal protein S18 acetylase RimI-like enzyme
MTYFNKLPEVNVKEYIIRPCNQKDIEEAVPLIYSAGPNAFNYVLNSQHKDEMFGFLKKLYLISGSEFSHQQHLGVYFDNKLIALGGIRYSKSNLKFMFNTAKQIFKHYSFMAALKVMLRAMQVEKILVPPKRNIGVIYDLAVSHEYRGMGIGTYLIKELIKRINDNDYTIVELDVASDNPGARRLYERMGFTEIYTRTCSLKNESGYVVDHTRMRLYLAH